MTEKSNNQISRETLEYLDDHHPKAVKFTEMAESLDTEEKILFKNLFFLEENSLIQLMSSYPAGATYPTIHMVKIRDEGKALLGDEERLDEMFPLKGFSSRLDFKKINNLSLSQILNVVASMIESGEIKTQVDSSTLLSEMKKVSEAPSFSEITLAKIFEKV